MLLIKKEITQNEDITLRSQKKRILNYCFTGSTCSILSNSVPCQSPASNIPNVPVELSERKSYLKSSEHLLVIRSLPDRGTKDLDNFFTDDLLEDHSLMQTLASFVYSWNAFNSLRATCDLSSKKNRKSLLKGNLHGIDLLCNEFVNLIRQCSECIYAQPNLYEKIRGS